MPKYYEFKIAGYYLYFTSYCVIECMHVHASDRRLTEAGSAKFFVRDNGDTVLQERGIELAVQCCEHLNRALVVEREVAEKRGFEIVNAIPQPHAGGSFAVTAWANFRDPVLVETIVADAGLDIGGTLIGMHLRRVAVPVRLSLKRIGEANILCARTRPKYIGGSRAVYQEL